MRTRVLLAVAACILCCASVALAEGPAPTPPRVLTPEQIQAVQSTQMHTLQRCWYLDGPQSVERTVRIRISIGVTGAVQAAVVTGAPPLESACLEAAVRLWQYPASTRQSEATFTSHLHPR